MDENTCSTEYQRMKMSLLSDIGKDTDEILDKLNHQEGTTMDNALPFFMAQNCNNNWSNNPFLYLIWLAFFGGGNGFGWGNNGAAAASIAANNDANAMLLQAINQGNNTSQRDIDRLATSMNISSSDVRNGLNNLQNAICQVGNTVGMTAPQIVNAIQSGNAQIASQLASCCCENRLAICEQTNTLGTGLSHLGFALQQEGCQTRQLMTELNYQGQIREQADKISELRAQASVAAVLNNNNNNSNALANTLAGINVALANLTALVQKIPTTTTTASA